MEVSCLLLVAVASFPPELVAVVAVRASCLLSASAFDSLKMLSKTLACGPAPVTDLEAGFETELYSQAHTTKRLYQSVRTLVSNPLH